MSAVDLWRRDLWDALDLGPFKARDLRCYVILRANQCHLTSDFLASMDELCTSLLTYVSSYSVGVDRVKYVYLMSRAMMTFTPNEVSQYIADDFRMQPMAKTPNPG